jgi:hypothetical protein
MTAQALASPSQQLARQPMAERCPCTSQGNGQLSLRQERKAAGRLPGRVAEMRRPGRPPHGTRPG